MSTIGSFDAVKAAEAGLKVVRPEKSYKILKTIEQVGGSRAYKKWLAAQASGSEPKRVPLQVKGFRNGENDSGRTRAVPATLDLFAHPMGNHISFTTDDGHSGSAFFWHVGNEFLSHGLFFYNNWEEITNGKPEISLFATDSEVIVNFSVNDKCVGMFVGDAESGAKVIPVDGSFYWH